MNGAELERLVLVGSDLSYLIDLPQDRLLTHTEVRLCAGILRRLLIDGQLRAAWRTVGDGASFASLAVESTDIDSALGQWPTQWIRYGWAGGAGAAGAHHTGIIFGVVPGAEFDRHGSMDAFMAANPLSYSGQLRRFNIDEWQKATSVAVLTDNIGLVKISRASVLKYIANHKGGVHFDPRRDFSSTVPKKSRKLAEYFLLDHGILRVGHLSGPEFEIASMVQSIARSEWAAELARVAEEAAPEDFHGSPAEIKFWAFERQPDGTNWATMTFENSSATDAIAGPR